MKAAPHDRVHARLGWECITGNMGGLATTEITVVEAISWSLQRP